MSVMSFIVRGRGAFADLFNRLDADDRVKGNQFERICKWFLDNE